MTVSGGFTAVRHSLSKSVHLPRPTHSVRSTAAILLAAGLLLIAFMISTYSIKNESLWNDEAWTAWAIRSPYVRDILQRIEADVHPPLYFLLIGGIGRTAGDSVLALRWPSALFGLIGLACIYALGNQLFDKSTGLIALSILGTTSFFVYYTREARMYSLLMMLSGLSTLLYVRWRRTCSAKRAIPYGVSVAALLYTHYAGIFIVASHLLHLVLSQIIPRWRIRKHPFLFLPPYVICAIIFLPWFPIFLNQMHSNPNGPLAIPVPTNVATIEALLLILTGGQWWLMVVPFVVGKAISRLRQYADVVVLLLFWLTLTPIGLLFLNAVFAPVYQVRYVIGMLPAGALLLAYGLRQFDLPRFRFGTRSQIRFSPLLVALLLTGLIATQLNVYKDLWPAKPAWENVIRQMITSRKPLEVTITDLAAYSPAAYYDRQLGIKRGIGLDLAWRLHQPDEVKQLVRKFDTVQSVWTALPVNTAKSWQVISQLAASRSIGYRSGLGNMIFYRFDRTNKIIPLQFQFGDEILFDGTLSSDQQLVIKAGDQLCTDINLKTLKTIDNSYSVGVHLVDITGNINAAQWDNGFGPHETNEIVRIRPCLDIGQKVSQGYYHLELTIYNWSTLERLPVLETSTTPAIRWGDILMMPIVPVQ